MICSGSSKGAGAAARADDPAFGDWMQKYLAAAKNLRSHMQVFCASLTGLDTQIGRLLQALNELKFAENTAIFMSSDNGPEDYRIANASNAGVGSACPLRAQAQPVRRRHSHLRHSLLDLGLVALAFTPGRGLEDPSESRSKKIKNSIDSPLRFC